ncbi:glycosyl hydrolase [Dactylosporangium sp. NPDC005572]|uniref:glycoside hydrolase family 26 protein n=1 Tax=Dactylosporangium sp. NPDC005572 TaxID=3156889 RepID=UPI0033BE259E
MRRTVVLALGAIVVITLAGLAGREAERPAPQSRDTGGTAAPASPAASPATAVAKPEDVLRDGPVFGVNALHTDPASVEKVATATGCRPGWVEVFSAVTGGVSAAQLAALPGVPLLALEPWQDGKVNDPRWTLAKTIDGSHDAEYRRIAAEVRAYGRPLLLRFAHEMNGAWYPWGPVGKNTPAQYREAWRHVVALFDAAGATNALWVWSPNIVRGAVRTPIREFYPGDDVVDFAGLTGYGEFEANPDATYKSTLDQLDKVTKKPLILTEVGVRPSKAKTGWLKAFGPWLKAHPRIVGFVWSMRPPGQGSRYDWRYDDSPANLAAFKDSLRQGGVAC